MGSKGKVQINNRLQPKSKNKIIVLKKKILLILKFFDTRIKSPYSRAQPSKED